MNKKEGLGDFMMNFWRIVEYGRYAYSLRFRNSMTDCFVIILGLTQNPRLVKKEIRGITSSIVNEKR